MEGDTRGASREACALVEDGAPVGGPPLNGEVANDAFPIEEVGGLPPRASRHSLTLYGAQSTRPPDKLILSSYLKSLEWNHLPAEVPTPDQEAARLLVRKCKPFYKRDSSVSHMRDLYPLSLNDLVVARYEENSIPFPSYLDKGSYRCVAEDGMYILNHNFNETTELV